MKVWQNSWDIQRNYCYTLYFEYVLHHFHRHIFTIKMGDLMNGGSMKVLQNLWARCQLIARHNLVPENPMLGNYGQEVFYSKSITEKRCFIVNP